MSSKYLGFTETDLLVNGGIHTAKEIQGQPELWQKTFQSVVRQKNEISSFLAGIFEQKDLLIILTGAGTSAYIGDVLEGPFQRNTSITSKAIATTDIVTHPEIYLPEQKPVLLISFARSGNSPESVQTVKIANSFCKNIYHFIITCNPDGELAKHASENNSFVFLLPPEANDKSLAMTGSFTSMLLAGILISKTYTMDEQLRYLETLVKYGNTILSAYMELMRSVSEMDFDRAVFLGSGPLRGVARESHLKLQELTDGRIICKHDSFLGFRHGPKAVVNEKTLMVYLISNSPYVQQYETDLIRAVNKSQKGIYRIALTENGLNSLDVDLRMKASCGEEPIPEAFWSICSILPAQIIGFFKSLNLGLKPDTPSESGTITRVVEGVNIYPYL
jgi:tagatose-6-phosphate ketose/aldose isomerase